MKLFMSAFLIFASLAMAISAGAATVRCDGLVHGTGEASIQTIEIKSGEDKPVFELYGSAVSLMYLSDGAMSILASYGGVGVVATGSAKYTRLDVTQRVLRCLEYDRSKTLCLKFDRSQTQSLKVTCREVRPSNSN